jgi:hypothetical protein
MVLPELVSRQCLILRSFVIQSNRRPYYMLRSCVLEYRAQYYIHCTQILLPWRWRHMPSPLYSPLLCPTQKASQVTWEHVTSNYAVFYTVRQNDCCKWMRNEGSLRKTFKVIKCGVGEGWGRSVGPIVWKIQKYYTESRRRGTSYIIKWRKADWTVIRCLGTAF